MLTMKVAMPLRRPGTLVGFAGLWLAALSVKADPIVIPGIPVFAAGTMIAFTGAILIEAVCISLFFQHSRAPRFFVLWLMGMHLVSYPLFLGLLGLCAGLSPGLPVLIGEGMIVLIEGGLIYLICRFVPSAKPEFPWPSAGRVLLASLIGNIASAVAFPVFFMLNGMFASWFGASAGD